MATRRRTTRTIRTTTSTTPKDGGGGIAKYILPAAALGIAAYLLWPKKALASPGAPPAFIPPPTPALPAPPIVPAPVQNGGVVVPSQADTTNAVVQGGNAGGAAGALGQAGVTSGGGLDPANAAIQAQLNGLQGTGTAGWVHRHAYPFRY